MISNFQLADWIIVLVIVLAVLGGFQQGFFRSIFSLAGLVVGLVLAAWNYNRAAAILMGFLGNEQVADAVGFITIALLVMIVAAILGHVTAKALRDLGLGCLDRLAGGVFGLVQGVFLVTLCITVALAFYPDAEWLREARLPRYFFGTAHLSAQLSPGDLAVKVHREMKVLEEQAPGWLHAK